MDKNAFDRIAKVLGAAASRRSGLIAALGAAIGVIELDSAAGARGRGRGADGSDGKSRRPTPEGPCGNGTKKDNACTKDTQCCTGYCKKGVKNKDGKGRCRCLRKGEPCKPSQTCCGSTTCVSGRCSGGRQPVPTGQKCRPNDTCEDAAAECTEYAGGSPAGTWCLLSGGSPCSAGSWCVSGSCPAGVCAAANGESCDGIACADAAASCAVYDIGPGSPAGNYCVLPLASACTADDECATAFCVDGTCRKCTVCAGGSCDYTTLYDATASATTGALIGIAPGVYDDTGIFSVSATVRRCGSRGSVDLSGQSGTPNFNGTCVICVDVTEDVEVSISDMLISGADGDQVVRLGARGALTLNRCTVSMITGGQVYSDPISVPSDTSLTLNECLITAIEAPNGGPVSVSLDAVLVATDTIFSDNSAPGANGGALFIDGGSVTLTRCTFTGNTAQNGGAIYIEQSTTPVTLTDCTISGNTAAEVGGGITVDVGYDTGLLTLAGTTTVTGNTAGVDGGGIAANYYSPGAITITGASGRTSGNTGGDQCILSHDLGAYAPVADCAYP